MILIMTIFKIIVIKHSSMNYYLSIESLFYSISVRTIVFIIILILIIVVATSIVMIVTILSLKNHCRSTQYYPDQGMTCSLDGQSWQFFAFGRLVHLHLSFYLNGS
jgi:hypothetical protein